MDEGWEGWEKGNRVGGVQDEGREKGSPDPAQLSAAGRYRHVHVEIEVVHGELQYDMKADWKEWQAINNCGQQGYSSTHSPSWHTDGETRM